MHFLICFIASISIIVSNLATHSVIGAFLACFLSDIDIKLSSMLVMRYNYSYEWIKQNTELLATAHQCSSLLYVAIFMSICHNTSTHVLHSAFGRRWKIFAVSDV